MIGPFRGYRSELRRRMSHEELSKLLHGSGGMQWGEVEEGIRGIDGNGKNTIK